jgi:hypothetical protein
MVPSPEAYTDVNEFIYAEPAATAQSALDTGLQLQVPALPMMQVFCCR